jgi:hypothetical protein
MSLYKKGCVSPNFLPVWEETGLFQHPRLFSTTDLAQQSMPAGLASAPAITTSIRTLWNNQS